MARGQPLSDASSEPEPLLACSSNSSSKSGLAQQCRWLQAHAAAALGPREPVHVPVEHRAFLGCTAAVVG